MNSISEEARFRISPFHSTRGDGIPRLFRLFFHFEFFVEKVR